MSNMVKHVGKYGEKPCVVLYREVPNEPDNCLIVLTESLDELKHDVLMNTIQSPEAQESNELSQVLHRRQFSDGTNILNTLHFEKKIQKVEVDKVSLTPMPNQSVPLADVNAELRKINGGYVPPKTDETHIADNPARANDSLAVADLDEAEGLLVQAQLLEDDAKQLVAEAKEKRKAAKAIQKKAEKEAAAGEGSA